MCKTCDMIHNTGIMEQNTKLKLTIYSTINVFLFSFPPCNMIFLNLSKEYMPFHL